MDSAQTAWTRSDAVAFVDDGERVAVLVLDHLDPFGARVLTGSAATIWRATRDRSHEDAIVAEAARTFQLDPGMVEADVQSFLVEMEALGLVVKQ